MISLSALISHHKDEDFERKFDTVIQNDLLDTVRLSFETVVPVLQTIQDIKTRMTVRTKLHVKYPFLCLKEPTETELYLENERLTAELEELRAKYKALETKMNNITRVLSPDNL